MREAVFSFQLGLRWALFPEPKPRAQLGLRRALFPETREKSQKGPDVGPVHVCPHEPGLRRALFAIIRVSPEKGPTVGPVGETTELLRIFAKRAHRRPG